MYQPILASRTYIQHFGYVKGDELFYLLPHRPIQVGIRPIKDDKDCIKMLAYQLEEFQANHHSIFDHGG